jgi:hypothetical protein
LNAAVAVGVLVLLPVLVLYATQLCNNASQRQHRAVLVTNFINSIKLSSSTLAVPTAATTTMTAVSSSAEEKALAWLIYKDPLQLWPNDTDADTDNDSRFRLQQRYALLTLLLALNVKDLELTNSSRECDWHGVRCSKTAHVIAISIQARAKVASMYSTLSPDLGLLTHLETLYVSGQDAGFLVGSLPSSLGAAWSNLASFVVSNNALTGSLPSLLGRTWTKLQRFDVGSNALTGSLPSSLGTTWTKLESFTVSRNAFNGSIPSLLGSTWSRLREFKVSDSALGGYIPSRLGTSWTHLKWLDVHKNTLTGTIPRSWPLPSWDLLCKASFHNNSITGSVPSGFCNNRLRRRKSPFELRADCNKVSCSAPCCTDC